MAIAALFKLRRGSGVARLERTRRLGVASGDAKSSFDSNEGDDSSAGSQKRRSSSPIGVPGPTLVRSWFSSSLSMIPLAVIWICG